LGLTICAGCANNRLLKQAATDTGKAAAGVTLPDLPPDCRKQEPHAALSVGTEALVALRQERRALDRQNARTGRCNGFYQDVAEGLRPET
jgi:hypothetical protein